MSSKYYLPQMCESIVHIEFKGTTIKTMCENVEKKDGRNEMYSPEKIYNRINNVCRNDITIPDSELLRIVKVFSFGLERKVESKKLDYQIADHLAALSVDHYDYALLGGRILETYIYKITPSTFSECVEMMRRHNYLVHNMITNNSEVLKNIPLVSERFYNFVMENKEFIDKLADTQPSYTKDYFSMNTFIKQGYLKSIRPIHDPKTQMIVERPAYCRMRVAIILSNYDLNILPKMFRMLNEEYFTPGSPVLFNSGSTERSQQLSSCFLLTVGEDSIEGIYDTLKYCAMISKNCGGIGLDVTKVRPKGSYIRSSAGTSSGVPSMLQPYNHTAKYVDQGGGKRKGAFAIYIQPWHPDLLEFIQLKMNTGLDEDRKCRDLYYAIWMPDIFMKRVIEGGIWSFISPDDSPQLLDLYGEEFDREYERLEAEKRVVSSMPARQVYKAILSSMRESGTPYFLAKDACNKKSNHKHLGIINSSNLCAEIVQYTSPEEVAVCNLASISLPRFVSEKETPNGMVSYFDFDKLREVTKVAVRALNNIIDNTTYPVKQAETSNKKHRPVGIGIQGLADVFAMMRMPFESDEAYDLNSRIAQHMYYAALEGSLELAKEVGAAYESFKGSPLSQGILQFDMWNVKPSDISLDWDSLKEQIKKHGTRNSLLIALMPTATTSQLLGNSESFEPFTNNIFIRNVLSGTIVVINKHMVKDLSNLGLWNEDMKREIIYKNGSIQTIEAIPKNIRDIYKTAWEIPMKFQIDMAAARGPYVCQSQSMNIYIENPEEKKIYFCHRYAFEKGLKTLSYYLRQDSNKGSKAYEVYSTTSTIQDGATSDSGTPTPSVTSTSSITQLDTYDSSNYPMISYLDVNSDTEQMDSPISLEKRAVQFFGPQETKVKLKRSFKRPYSADDNDENVCTFCSA